MPRLLSLSYAARLVGTSRSKLQKHIQDGVITSFEGKINLTELTQLYPQTITEDTIMLDRVEEIIEQACFKARNHIPMPTDKEGLLIRASALAKELTLAKLELGNYAIFTQKIKSKLNKLSETDNPEIKEILHALNDWIQAELPKTSKSNTLLHQLLTQNKKSRPITTHVQILPSGHECLLEGNITLLEAGLNAGLALNYGCSNGNCGNCKAKLISGQIKKSRPSDYCFSETEKTQNYILMCTTTALTDVIIEADEANKIQDIPLQNIIAKVKKLDSANDTVSILNLKTPRTKRLRFLAGQQVKLSINDALSKVLSIASCPCDDMNIQFHITSQDNNPFSKYILEQLKFGDEVTIEGPQGEFILSDDASNTVILIAMDTGFAPIKSLAEHTMTLAHAENVHIHWLTSEKQEHYMRHQCRAWADAFDSFQYFEAGLQHNLNTDKGKEELNTQLSKIIGAYPNIDSCHIYLAGNKHFIEISKGQFNSLSAPRLMYEQVD